MKNLLAMLIGAFLISGCATIVDNVSGNKMQKIYLTTPTGKSVVATINDKKVTLPAVVEVSKSADTTINVFAADNPGYHNYTATLSSLNAKNTIRTSWWYNSMFGLSSTTSSGADYLMGGMFQYSQPVVILPLTEK